MRTPHTSHNAVDGHLWALWDLGSTDMRKNVLITEKISFSFHYTETLTRLFSERIHKACFQSAEESMWEALRRWSTTVFCGARTWNLPSECMSPPQSRSDMRRSNLSPLQHIRTFPSSHSTERAGRDPAFGGGLPY